MALDVCLNTFLKEPLCAGDQIFYYRTIDIAERKQDECCALNVKVEMERRYPVLSLDNNKHVPLDHKVKIISKNAGGF